MISDIVDLFLVIPKLSQHLTDTCVYQKCIVYHKILFKYELWTNHIILTYMKEKLFQFVSNRLPVHRLVSSVSLATLCLVASIAAGSNSEYFISFSSRAWIPFNYNQIIRFLLWPFQFQRAVWQIWAVRFFPQSAEHHSILYCRNRYLGHEIGKILRTKISKSFAIALRYFHYFKEWQ